MKLRQGMFFFVLTGLVISALSCGGGGGEDGGGGGGEEETGITIGSVAANNASNRQAGAFMRAALYAPDAGILSA